MTPLLFYSTILLLYYSFTLLFCDSTILLFYHSFTLLIFFSILLLYYSLTLLFFGSTILLLYYSFTLLFFDSATLLLCYSLTLLFFYSSILLHCDLVRISEVSQLNFLRSKSQNKCREPCFPGIGQRSHGCTTVTSLFNPMEIPKRREIIIDRHEKTTKEYWLLITSLHCCQDTYCYFLATNRGTQVEHSIFLYTSLGCAMNQGSHSHDAHHDHSKTDTTYDHGCEDGSKIFHCTSQGFIH